MSIEIMFQIVVCLQLLRIARTDWKTKQIPNRDLQYLLIVVLASIWEFEITLLLDKIIGMLIVSMPLFFIAVMWPSSFGGGDVKLMAICGILLGSKGILHAFWIALLVAVMYCVWLLVLGKGRKTVISFGPFLCLGVIVTMLEIF